MKLLNYAKLTKQLSTLGLALLTWQVMGLVQAEPILDIATTPLSTSGPTVIKPNMLYVLDDSGSMGRDYMPDWATDGTYQDDASYNAVAYNPEVRYDPPAYYTGSGFLNTTTYPSQTGVSTSSGANFESKPNWRYVDDNAYRGNSFTNLEGLNGGLGPQYTVTIANEYCTRSDLRECVAQNLPSASHPFPARIRWCANAADVTAVSPAVNACQSVRVGAFTNMRLPLAPPGSESESTITFNGANGTPRVRRIRINGFDIMRDRTGTTNNMNTMANMVADQINQCTNNALGDCDVAGYSATANGNRVSIIAPGSVSGTPVLTVGSLPWWGYFDRDVTAFASAGGGPATRETVTITPTDNEYPLPGRTTSAGGRTDCAGAICTYAEEMTNYANWYTYYRTRMQLMKTSTSLAFKDVGTDFRMGFMTINSNAALDFKEFSGSDKAVWYSTLFAVSPNGGTPLPLALSNAGRVYANKYTQSGAFSDPIQYACQANYALLTTDGVYNGDNSYRSGRDLDGNYIEDEDSASTVERPKRDGLAQSRTLADVAKYYRDTDLRTAALGNCSGASGSGVCETSGTLDKVQSMVTFTLGLGVDGALAYSATYEDDTTGDFADIKSGVKQWPDVDQTNFNFGIPDDIAAARTDDVWHAAVNGDGKYFSAKKTQDLIDQLREAISLIKVKTGAGAAAATSTLNPVSADNFAYVASYTTGLWTGNLEKREIDITTGEIQLNALTCVEDVVPTDNCAAPSIIEAEGNGSYSCVTQGVTDATSCLGTLIGTECRVPVQTTCDGSLKEQLENGPRTVYFSTGGALSPFLFNNLTADQTINFAPSFLQSQLTQGASLTNEQLVNLTGENLVNYLKGDKTYETGAALPDNRVFRKRTAVLGDLIDSKPSFIGKATFNYGDSGYQDFKNAQATRSGTVYVGANDGMLHAFDSDTLQERWAFIPSAVIPNLWKLADSNYAANHQYYVNGDLTISDVCVAADCSAATASDWKTILVAGLDGGGRGYYALDITNPASPQLLWEIDPNTAGFHNLGYSYGNPIITKRNGDDKWVVIFSSGYNNIPDNNGFYTSVASTGVKPTGTTQLQFNSGDGKGYLYVVEAKTGNLLQTTSTGVGTVLSPSGLGKISAYVDNAEVNNLTTYIYGGDLDGNVWRFNVSSTNNTVLHFAQLKDANGVVQPVMTPPELGEIGDTKVIYVGTGKYLELSDLDTSAFTPQSLYALKDVSNDNDPGPVYNNPRSVAGFVNQSVVPSADPTKPDERVSGSNNAVDLTTDIGWYIDFPDSGERQNVASQLVLGTLLVPTTVPTASACQPAGYGWFNYLDYRTGLSVINPFGAVSQRTSAPSVGFNVVYVDGKPKVSNVLADDPNPALVEGVQFNAGASGFQFRRSIWRELQ